MQHSESIAKLAAALVAAQGELKAIAKDRANPFFKSHYATLDGILGEVRPTLAKHGLAVVQSATAAEGPALSVETMLVHQSGEWLSGTAVVPLAKVDPQGAGSALTYGRRYGIAALLSLATEDDDDGNVATAQHRANAKERKPSEAKQPESKPVPKTVRSPLMTIGKKKGTPLSQIPTDDLQSAAQWCNSDEEKRAKFAQLLADIDEEIANRGVPMKELDLAV